MKKLLSLLVLAGMLATVQAQKQDESPFMTKSFSNASIKNVKAQTSGGNISVSSVPASEAKVEVYVWPSDGRNKSISKDEIQKRLDEDYDLTVAVSGGTLTVIAKSKKRNLDWKKALSVSFRVFVPRNISTDLTTSGGNVTLTDLAGTQEFTTSGGNLNIDKIKGKINGTTSGGNINVSNSDNDIELTTSGGNVTADKCTGKIKLVTSGGSVKMSNLNGNIDAATSGGNVVANDIRGELEAHTSGGNVNMRDLYCSIEASTSGGQINVSVKELGKYVRLENSGGNIELELPANKGLDLKLSGDKIKTDLLGNFKGKIEEDEINGTVNGGGTPVTVSASSGRISLKWK